MRMRPNRYKNEVPLNEACQGDGPTSFQAVEAWPDPEHQCSVREVFALLNKALHRLKARYFEVVEMRHIQELSGKEVA